MSFDTRLEQLICKPLIAPWFNYCFGCDIVAGRRGVTCRTVVLKHCSESRVQLPSILCATLSSLSVTSLIFCATDFGKISSVAL